MVEELTIPPVLGAVVLSSWMGYIVRGTIDKKANFEQYEAKPVTTTDVLNSPIKNSMIIIQNLIHSPYKHLLAWFAFLLFGICWSCAVVGTVVRIHSKLC